MIVALSAFGAFEGIQKGSTPVTADDLPVPLTGATAPPPPETKAKTATALPEPPPPTVAALSESQIRNIVRQEVQTALAKAQAESDPLAQQEPQASSTPPTVKPAGAVDPRTEAELLSGVGRGAQ